jgi:small subunit ribosomal protein S8e
MTQWHEKSDRKETGGILRTKDGVSKRLSQKGGEFTATTLSTSNENKAVKGMGNTTKIKLTKAHKASVTDQKTGKSQVMNIIWVHENSANRLYVRRNIITKGTLIEVEANGNKAFARVTSRPGQTGTVTAVLASAPADAKKTNTRTTRTGKTSKTAAKKNE